MKIVYFITLIFLVCFSSCKKKTVITIPQGITTEVTSKGTDFINVSGAIESDGGEELENIGICWSIHKLPVLTDNYLYCQLNKSGIEISINKNKQSFSGEILNLEPATTYYVRTFAKNSKGIIYGNEVVAITQSLPSILPILFNPSIQYDSIQDNEGNYYKTVVIGNQTWMAENLKTKHFNNGDLIPENMWKIYNNSEVYVPVYGRLYTYLTIEDTRGICPEGWHIPSKSEWETLQNTAGNNEYNLRETGTVHWESGIGLNSTGFTGIPSGFDLDGSGIKYMNTNSDYWSCTYSNNLIGNVALGNGITFYSDKKTAFFSIRCIKN